MKFNHIIEINIKDNKYRIIYKLVDLAGEDYGYNAMTLNCINLSGNRDLAVEKYLENMDVILKKGMIGKDKRERYKLESKLSFDEINTDLINDMKSTILSIEKSISINSKDGW